MMTRCLIGTYVSFACKVRIKVRLDFLTKTSKNGAEQHKKLNVELNY